MGKKASGKHSTSKGERRSSMSTKNTDPGVRMMNKMDALNKGKDVYFTIDNPNKSETDKRQIRIKVSGRDWIKNGRNKGHIMRSAAVGAD